jgi:hypothetical protein
MSRIVRAGLIQASNVLGADKPLEKIKKAMIDKHLKLIEQAAKLFLQSAGQDHRAGQPRQR